MEIHHTVEDKYCYSKIAGTMLDTFPEVREQYAKELRWISDTFQGQETGGQSLYFDRCFCDFLGRLLAAEKPDNRQLERVFDFLENMASSDDADVSRYVKSFRPDHYGEGEDGVTVAELK